MAAALPISHIADAAADCAAAAATLPPADIFAG
jgi:hypothetical protein